MKTIRSRKNGYTVTLVHREGNPRVWASITQQRKVVWADWLSSPDFSWHQILDKKQGELFVDAAFSFAREDGKIPAEAVAS